MELSIKALNSETWMDFVDRDYRKKGLSSHALNGAIDNTARTTKPGEIITSGIYRLVDP